MSDLNSDHSDHITFGNLPFSSLQLDSINKKLNDVEQDDISYRSGVGGTKLAYIEGWKLIKIANDIFGFNGWSTSILSMTTEFVDVENQNAVAKISAGVSCHVRVTLKDGTFHEDIGFGSAENFKNKSGALEKAKKEAVTDATKRALRYFGYALGLSTYDKDYLSDLKNATGSCVASVAGGATVYPVYGMGQQQHATRQVTAAVKGMEYEYSGCNNGQYQQQQVHVSGINYQSNRIGSVSSAVNGGNGNSAVNGNTNINNQTKTLYNGNNTSFNNGNNNDNSYQQNTNSFQNNNNNSYQNNNNSFQQNTNSFQSNNNSFQNNNNNSYQNNNPPFLKTAKPNVTNNKLF